MDKQDMEKIMEVLKTMLASMDAHRARMEAETEATRA
jgi:hypothetical protein